MLVAIPEAPETTAAITSANSSSTTTSAGSVRSGGGQGQNDSNSPVLTSVHGPLPLLQKFHGRK